MPRRTGPSRGPASRARRRWWRIVGVALVLGVPRASAGYAPPSEPAPASRGAARALLHLRLEKSEPADGAVLPAAPTQLQFWFSLPPELAVTVVRLADAAGRQVPLGAPQRGTGRTDPVRVQVKEALAAGRYTVSWKTSSRDGHPIRGTFAFTVRGA